VDGDGGAVVANPDVEFDVGSEGGEVRWVSYLMSLIGSLSSR